jgi:hypothetical protein
MLSWAHAHPAHSISAAAAMVVRETAGAAGRLVG